MVLVDPRAGTRVDTADFLRADGRLLGFSGRPLAAAYRERVQMSAAFLLVRSREAMDHLALAAIVRSTSHELMIDPRQGDAQAIYYQHVIDLRAWLHERLQWNVSLREFARVRGWQKHVDALLSDTSDSAKKV